MHDRNVHFPVVPPQRPSAWTVFLRAMHLRCPECGISPLFVPARKVRSIWNWFTPLDGCPRCGYAYERESGYFLMATWAFNYGIVCGTGLIIGLLVDHFYQPSLTNLILVMAIPFPIFAVLFARHAKSLYLAMDHYIDPHRQTSPPKS
jgi:uncharacterized protein (DUF983 family)